MQERLEGVSESDALQKQVGDSTEKENPSQNIEEAEQKSNPNDQKGNEVSASGKGKAKVFEDDEDKEELSEELEAKEAKARIVKVTLETQKSLFLPWTMERIHNEAVNNPNTHCLDPSLSFNLNNTIDFQLDFLITPKAFLIQCFEKIEKAPLSNYVVNHMLFYFYLKYGKPQYQTWSS
ncbi:unnamed protein product [Lactuca saligna]|uniref:Uncharacterized protein n=1 Tax=Lactuca saligna TaxID=75948 RepID=A0AA35VFH0_LACSI|nr:unnamed protein product [Lactuca saligna]